MSTYTPMFEWSIYDCNIEYLSENEDELDIITEVLADVINDLQKENQKLKNKIIELEKATRMGSYVTKTDYDIVTKCANQALIDLKSKSKELKTKDDIMKAKDDTIRDMANKLADAGMQVEYWKVETERLESKLTKIMDVLQGKIK